MQKKSEPVESITNEPIISIGTMAEKLGVSVSTIRKYETAGLLISSRTESGHRLFSVEDIDRLQTIQHMIQDVGFNIEGIRRMQAMIPCWEILPCTEKKKKKCQAATENTRPCWMIKELDCANGDREKCRQCLVYRFGSRCIEETKGLVHGRKPGDNIREKMEELINNRSKSKKEA